MEHAPARTRLQNRFLDLVDVLLPARARRDGWAATEGHVLKRMVLDQTFNDRWTRHVDRSLHPERKLNDTQLAVAVGIAERMLDADAAEVLKMYRRSQSWHATPAAAPPRPAATRMRSSRQRNVRPPRTTAR